VRGCVRLPGNFRAQLLTGTRAYNPTMSAEFLDRLASQLKVGKEPARRRAIERVLDVIKKSYENGKYQNETDAERDFRQLIEREENSGVLSPRIHLR
jgi:hypothetical protein